MIKEMWVLASALHTMQIPTSIALSSLVKWECCHVLLWQITF